VSLLSLIPHLIKAGCRRLLVPCGVWLGGTLLLLGFRTCWLPLGGWRLGTLLGPEETPLLWVLFSGLLLVRLSNGSFFGLVATVRCWGVVVC